MKIRPFAKIHGGKARIASKFLIPLLPKNFKDLEFYDLFGGGGNFLLQCPKAKKETYNDIDPNLCNLMTQIVKNGNKIIERINCIPYSEEQFLKYSSLIPENDIDRAIREIVIRRMSRGGLMAHFSKSKRLRGGRMGDENAWLNWREHHLPKAIERFSELNVTNNDAIDMMLNECNKENCIIYSDPTYFPSTRTAPKVYKFEMTEKDHVRLLEAACTTKAKVMISGYDCEIYRKYLKRWKMKSIAVPNNSSQAKSKEYRIECAWTNY